MGVVGITLAQSPPRHKVAGLLRRGAFEQYGQARRRQGVCCQARTQRRPLQHMGRGQTFCVWVPGECLACCHAVKGLHERMQPSRCVCTKHAIFAHTHHTRKHA
eukprot:362961-Chlamydomonas_euryale.AAC.7